MDEFDERCNSISFITIDAWEERVRSLLHYNTDTRQRLQLYGLLSEICCENKQFQLQVGTLLQENLSDSTTRLDIVQNDLKAKDRTLRVAAARLVCHLVYECVENQQHFIQTATSKDSTVSYSIGWLQVFSIPPAIEAAYRAQCKISDVTTSPCGLYDFIYSLVVEQYASVYHRIGLYYTSGCADFLPLCWHRTLASDTDTSEHDVIPDPAESILGFYLVPRASQFLEPDNIHDHILLQSMSKDDVLQLHVVKEAFSTATTSDELVESNVFEAVCRANVALHWLSQYKEICPAPWDPSRPSSQLTWSDVLVYATLQLNLAYLTSQFGDQGKAVITLYRLFNQLSLPQSNSATTTYVWEASLVAAILTDSTLPEAFKRPARSMIPRPVQGVQQPSHKTMVATAAAFSKSTSSAWHPLLHLSINDIVPVSLAVFLAKWRIACMHIIEKNSNHRSSSIQSVHVATPCSVPQLRKSFSGLPPTAMHSRRSGRLWTLAKDENESISYHRDEDEDAKDEDPLEEEDVQELFHKMQRSMSSVDDIALRQREEKLSHRQKREENVALHRQQANQQEHARRIAIEERLHAKSCHMETLTEQKAQAHVTRIERERLRREEVLARKQQQIIKEQTRLAAMTQLLNDEESERQQELENKREHQRSRRPSSPVQPAKPRPVSARHLRSRAISSSPEILRQRAQLYGHVVSKMYKETTTAKKSPSQHSFHPPQFARSFSNFRISESFNVKAPITASPLHRSRRLTRPTSSKAAEAADPNACTTLVMQHAVETVGHRIQIPDIPAPAVEEPHIPPFIIAAQYAALEDKHKVHFRQRFNLRCVSHRLSYAVLKQYTNIIRRDLAWQAFHDVAINSHGTNPRIKHSDFIHVSQKLGIALSERKLYGIARQLDMEKSGMIEWKIFYSWWSMQYDDLHVI